jgi:Kef-type K+ transport system membrane component KefB
VAYPSIAPNGGSYGLRIIGLIVTLILLFGIAYVAFSARAPAFPGAEVAVLIGFILLIANVTGRLAASAGLPRLTGYLIVGILAGPSVSGMISIVAVDDLALIDSFALALIALMAGGELKLSRLRPQARTILYVTLAVTGVVWAGMTLLILLISPLVPFLWELPFTGTLAVALILGIWAANSSPDLTVAVIEETHASGPLADVVLGVTIVKDVLVIVLFTLTMAVVAPLLNPGEQLDGHALVELGREVGGAILLGAGLGWVFSFYLGDDRDRSRSPLATFLFAYLMVVLSERLQVELLLTGVAAGFLIENLSPAGDRMIRGIESVSVVIFAFFFAVAGARLELAAVREFWLAALIIFSGRVWLTRRGARIGLERAGASVDLRAKTWQGLISQGGVTLGLVLLIEERFPSVGADIVALGMAVIIGSILGGPILLKRAITMPSLPEPGNGEI